MKNYCYSCMNELNSDGFCPYCQRENIEDNVVYRLRAGTILNNKYLVGNCIGEGGFGVTYIGRDLTLDMRIAIKEYFPNGYANRNNTVDQVVTATTGNRSQFFQKGKDSFLEEARKIAKFSGEPGIVGVRDFFEENGTAYIIMEYLDGENLSSNIAKVGLFDPYTMFELMLPITRSLERIHEAGIIHRDISPDNIMYLRNGTLKLMDFGSARYFTNAQKEMSVVLKQGYAPEEQYRKSGDQGPWTDVYGLCATMYRCITGKIPEDALDRLREDRLQPPSALGVQISQPIENVLMYGLAVFKENRCKDMHELSLLMEDALYGQSVDVPENQYTYQDAFRSAATDDYYKSRVTVRMNTDAPPYPQTSDQGPQEPPVYTPLKKKGPGSKAVVAVIIVSAVIVTGTLAFLAYLFFGNPSFLHGRSQTATEAPLETVVSGGKVAVPACENKSLDYSTTVLENLGLKVETEYEKSNDVDEDCVIKQSVSEGTQVETGSVVKLTVSSGPEPCPYDYEQKLTVTASSGSSYGDAVLYEWKNGDWESIAEYDASLGSNGIGEAREGKSLSPEGLHKLGVVLCSDSIDTNMDTYHVTSSTCVVDDSSSSLYNRIMETSQVPSGVSYDRIGKGLTDGTTYATIYIEHNGSGLSSDGVTAGHGSAIGLRGQYGSLKPTYGDVDISASDMKDLLSKLDADKNPMIEVTVD